MNVLSLFSGIGGLDLGLERAGMTVVGQVEIDPYCQRVLAKHWPEVPRHDDVRTCVEWWRSKARPAVDLVCGGFPCQGHSVAGRREGTGDARWGWPWFRDVLDQLQPPAVLIENVPNLVRTGLLDVLRDLARLGFDAWWSSIPAAAVGAPHLRWRLFVIAAHPQRVELRHEPGWRGGQDWADTTVAGHDGAAWTLADANGEGRRAGSRLGWSRPAIERDGWWAVEPDVGRVAHGIPHRVDRLRALGNAVVPQVAQHVGELILAAETAATAAPSPFGAACPPARQAVAAPTLNRRMHPSTASAETAAIRTPTRGDVQGRDVRSRPVAAASADASSPCELVPVAPHRREGSGVAPRMGAGPATP